MVQLYQLVHKLCHSSEAAFPSIYSVANNSCHGCITVVPGNVTHNADGSILAWVGVALIDLLLAVWPREASGGAVAAVAVRAEVSTGAVVAGGLVTAGVHINIAQGSIVALLTCTVIGMSTVAMYYVYMDRSWEGGESNRMEVK